jgi:hypothetical protein
MPGIGELIDGAMQQAPQPLRQAAAGGGVPAGVASGGEEGLRINLDYRNLRSDSVMR